MSRATTFARPCAASRHRPSCARPDDAVDARDRGDEPGRRNASTSRTGPACVTRPPSSTTSRVGERDRVDRVVGHDDAPSCCVRRAARAAARGCRPAVSGSSEVSGSSSSSSARATSRAHARGRRAAADRPTARRADGRRARRARRATSQSSALCARRFAFDSRRAPRPERHVLARAEVREQPRILAEQHDAAACGRARARAASRRDSTSRSPMRTHPSSMRIEAGDRRRAASTCPRRSGPSRRPSRRARRASATSSRKPRRASDDARVERRSRPVIAGLPHASPRTSSSTRDAR